MRGENFRFGGAGFSFDAVADGLLMDLVEKTEQEVGKGGWEL